MNNFACGFDNGDCCYFSQVLKDFCLGCLCLAGNTFEENYHPLIGDGYCHDQLNYSELNYDGGDCCLSNKNTTFCYNCSCLANWIWAGIFRLYPCVSSIVLPPLGLRGGKISPTPVHDSMFMVLWISNLSKILSKKFRFDHALLL